MISARFPKLDLMSRAARFRRMVRMNSLGAWSVRALILRKSCILLIASSDPNCSTLKSSSDIFFSMISRVCLRNLSSAEVTAISLGSSKSSLRNLSLSFWRCFIRFFTNNSFYTGQKSILCTSNGNNFFWD